MSFPHQGNWPSICVLTAMDSDKPSPVEEFPMREWSIQLHLLDEDGNERPANVFTKVTYNLHPTFENPVQSKSACLRLPRGSLRARRRRMPGDGACC